MRRDLKCFCWQVLETPSGAGEMIDESMDGSMDVTQDESRLLRSSLMVSERDRSEVWNSRSEGNQYTAWDQQADNDSVLRNSAGNQQSDADSVLRLSGEGMAGSLSLQESVQSRHESIPEHMEIVPPVPSTSFRTCEGGGSSATELTATGETSTAGEGSHTKEQTASGERSPLRDSLSGSNSSQGKGALSSEASGEGVVCCGRKSEGEQGRRPPDVSHCSSASAEAAQADASSACPPPLSRPTTAGSFGLPPLAPVPAGWATPLNAQSLVYQQYSAHTSHYNSSAVSGGSAVLQPARRADPNHPLRPGTAQSPLDDSVCTSVSAVVCNICVHISECCRVYHVGIESIPALLAFRAQLSCWH